MKSSKLKLASIILAVVLCLLVLSAPAGAVVQPNSDFYVLDNENVLSAETEKYIIDRNLNLVSNCKGAQVCVVVTDSTNGQDIEEYATELFNAWGIGSKTEDNGVLILFLTDDDNYWIMPGIGLERVLTERVLRQIIDDDCEPSFARKDYDSAAKATFIAINQVVCNYYSQDPNGSGDSDNFPNNNGNNYYPDDHEVYYVYNNFDLKIEKIQLCDMDRQKLYDFSVNFLIKPLDNFQKKLYDIAVLNDVVRILRGQMPLGQVTIPFNHAGCSWDKQQTHVSVRENMLEEAYEVVEAIDSDDQDNLIEELGDVLLQVMLHSQIAEETGEFTLKEVVQGICEKLIRRHPHVFGSENAQTAGQALASWDNIKKIEKKNASISDSIDGLPKVMPALEKAYKIWGKIQKTKYVDDCSYEGGRPLQNSEDIGIALLKIVEESKKLGMNPELALLEQVQQLTQRFRNWEAKK